MFAHQRVSCDPSLNRYTFLPWPGSQRSGGSTSSGYLLSRPTSSPTNANADNTKLFFSPIDTCIEACASACRADICSWTPASHINLNTFFLLHQVPPFVEAHPQTTKNLGVKARTMQPDLLFFSCCPNSSHHSSVLLQVPAGWAPTRLFSSLYNSNRRLQLVSFSSALNSFHFSPFSLALWLLILNSEPRSSLLSSHCVPSGAMTSPPLTGLHSGSLSLSRN